MSLTLEQAKSLQKGDRVHLDGFCSFTIAQNGEESVQSITWVVSGQIKTWKSDDDRVSFPIKYGSGRSKLSNRTVDGGSLHEFHVEDHCPALAEAFEHSLEEPGSKCDHRKVSGAPLVSVEQGS